MMHFHLYIYSMPLLNCVQRNPKVHFFLSHYKQRISLCNKAVKKRHFYQFSKAPKQ